VFSNTIQDCVLEGNNTPRTSGTNIIVDGAWLTRILNNTLEASIDSHILLTNKSGYVPSGTLIWGNKFSIAAAPIQAYDIDIRSANDTVIEHNTFPRSGGQKQPVASVREGGGTRLVYMGVNRNLVRTGTGISNVQVQGIAP
jgi:hypothetical protein